MSGHVGGALTIYLRSREQAKSQEDDTRAERPDGDAHARGIADKV